MHMNRIAMAVLAIFVASAPALAKDFTMNFDGITKAGTSTEPDLKGVAEVLGYYNGDPVFKREGRQEFDVTFRTGALAITNVEGLGLGSFPKPPSGFGAVGAIASGAAVTFDLSAGLSLTNLAFYYSTLPDSGAVLQLLSGDSIVFSDNLTLCTAADFCPWQPYKLSDLGLSVLGTSLVTGVKFGAKPNTAVFDDISLSTTATSQPIPEPSSIALAALGLALAAGLARRRVA